MRLLSRMSLPVVLLGLGLAGPAVASANARFARPTRARTRSPGTAPATKTT